MSGGWWVAGLCVLTRAQKPRNGTLERQRFLPPAVAAAVASSTHWKVRRVTSALHVPILTSKTHLVTAGVQLGQVRRQPMELRS